MPLSLEVRLVGSSEGAGKSMVVQRVGGMHVGSQGPRARESEVL